MQYRLFQDDKLIGLCQLDLDSYGTACIAAVNTGVEPAPLLFRLERCKVDSVSANGMALSGFSKIGEYQYTYVELWLAYPGENE